MLLNSPIIIYCNEKGINIKDNLLYSYTDSSTWHSIEVIVGDSTFPGANFVPSEKIIIQEDTLSYIYRDELVSKIISSDEKKEISKLLGRVNRNSTFQSFQEAADLCGFQIKVDQDVIYTSYPSSDIDTIGNGIYSDLMSYIMQLSPVPFTYEDFGY